MSVLKENNIQVEKNEEQEAHITGTLSVALIEKHTKGALEFFSQNLSLDGFRKGNIPENVVRKHVSETAILEEAASRALNEIYPDIIKEEELDVFGRPRVNFTKLAPGNPVEFTIDTPLMPKIEVADYKEIAKELNGKREKVVLDEEELEKALLEVRKELDRRDKESAETKEEKAEAKEGEEKESTTAEAEPSPLTDEKVQKISPMKTVEEFKESVREDLTQHKQNQADEKHRLEVIEKILEKSSVALPDMIIESELQGMLAQFAADVDQAGIKMEDYLKQAGKTQEEIEKEWRPHAESRAKMQLILNHIATKEELFPNKEEVDHQVGHILEHNPKADRGRAEVYVETQLANAAVFSFLEKQ